MLEKGRERGTLTLTLTRTAGQPGWSAESHSISADISAQDEDAKEGARLLAQMMRHSYYPGNGGLGEQLGYFLEEIGDFGLEGQEEAEVYNAARLAMDDMYDEGEFRRLIEHIKAFEKEENTDANHTSAT